MSAGRRLTLAQLREAGACNPYLQLFERLFGAEVLVDVPSAEKHAMWFDWGWASRHLLSKAGYLRWAEGTGGHWIDVIARAKLFAQIYVNDDHTR